MPVVQVTMVEGRDEETVQKCLMAIAKTVHETLGAPYSSIRVFANKVPPTLFIAGEHPKAEIAPKPTGSAQ